MFARDTEVGSRLLVSVACAGSESHGRYLPDGKIAQKLGGSCKGKDGEVLKERLWTELSAKLEDIKKGVVDQVVV